MRCHYGKWIPRFALFAALVLSPPLLADCASPDARIMTLPVRALKGSFQVLNTLQPSDFILTDSKVPIDICSVAHDRQPSSGNFAGHQRKYARRQVRPVSDRARGHRLLDTSQPGDEHFLEYVSDVAVMRCGFGCDVRQIRDGLQVEPKGKTALIDGLYMGFARCPKRAIPTGRCWWFPMGSTTAAPAHSKTPNALMRTRPLRSFFSYPPRPAILFVARGPW